MGKYSGKTCRLLCMLALTASFFLVEIVVGYITNSLALVGDSYHMLSDVVALLVGFASVRIAKWPRDIQRNTFGWARAEVLGALVNSVFLMALCFTIFVEALQRMFHDEHIHDPELMLIVGSIGLAINIVGLFLFHGHGHSHGGGGHGHSHGGGHGHSHGPAEEEMKNLTNNRAKNEPDKLKIAKVNGAVAYAEPFTHELTDLSDESLTVVQIHSSSQLNMRGVFLHVLGDALGSVIVIISALVIKFNDKEWRYKIDPAMSMVMVIIILSTTIPLLRESAMILLQTVPTHIQVKNLQDKLLEKVDGVLGIHEFHVWQLAGNRIIASAHIRCQNLRNYMIVAEKVKTFFHNEGIHSTTIQPEFIEDEIEDDHPIRTNRDSCLLFSCDADGCETKRCCTESEELNMLLQDNDSAETKLRRHNSAPAGSVATRRINAKRKVCSTALPDKYSSPDIYQKGSTCMCKPPVFNLQCETCGRGVQVDGAFNIPDNNTRVAKEDPTILANHEPVQTNHHSVEPNKTNLPVTTLNTNNKDIKLDIDDVKQCYTVDSDEDSASEEYNGQTVTFSVA